MKPTCWARGIGVYSFANIVRICPETMMRGKEFFFLPFRSKSKQDAA
jgi:hypothetical protein